MWWNAAAVGLLGTLGSPSRSVHGKKHKDSRPTHKPTHTECDHIHTEMHMCANAHAVAYIF